MWKNQMTTARACGSAFFRESSLVEFLPKCSLSLTACSLAINDATRRVLAARGVFPVAFGAGFLGAAPPAFSADECGPAGGIPLTVICSNTALNPYATGIEYYTGTGLDMIVEEGIIVDRNSGRDLDGIRLRGTAGSDLLRVEIKDGASITTNGSIADGVQVEAQLGSGSSIELISGANIDVTVHNPLPADEGSGTNGLLGWISNTSSLGDILIRQNQHSTINIRGYEGTGVYGLNRGLGSIFLESYGEISTAGFSGYGMNGWNINSFATGDVVLVLRDTGRIQADGLESAGLYSLNEGFGDATVLNEGYVETLQALSEAAIAYVNNVSSSGNARVEVSDGATGITRGARSAGARAINSGNGEARVQNDGTVLVTGSQSHGLRAQAIGGGDALVTNTRRAEATGEYGIGIAATSDQASALVQVGAGATVIGGWQADVSGVGADTNRPAAGVILHSASGSVLENAGSIGAGSDRAVADASRWDAPLGNLTIRNGGTITGFVELGATANNRFTNAAGALFDVRHFADTDGDGVRDAKRVSISDFGAASSTFDNVAGARVRFAPVLGNTATDAAGYYVPTTGLGARPLETDFYDIDRAGVVQGQFLNLGTFINAGLIDLRGSAIGNTLLMTGDPAPGGAAGGGVFVSDGGQLLLNTFFNAGVVAGGGSGSYSDVLIVDTTQLASGPTTITIGRREGPGAVTPHNGILLVEVRNKSASASDAFVLNGDYLKDGQQRVIGGAYAYSLFHHGVGADGADGNWYLRNVAVSPTVPVYQEYPKVLIPLIDVPTLQQRVGNRYWNNPSYSAPAQTVFCKDASQNYRCALTEEQASYHLGVDGKTIIESNGFWGRIDGSRGHYEAISQTIAAEHDATTLRMQAGIDALVSDRDSGRLIGGLTLHYAYADADIYSTLGSGKINAHGFGFGGTLTWYGYNGFYVDTQAQLTFLNADIASSTVGTTVADGVESIGFAHSIETGRKFALDRNWSIKPQTQLIYSRLNFTTFRDVFGTTVALVDGDSLRGRLGLAAEYQDRWTADNGTSSRVSAYGIANVYNEFLDGTRVSISDFNAESRDDSLWGGIGLGGAYNWNDDNYSVYGETSVKTGLEHFGRSHQVSGTLGLRVKW